MHSLFDVSTLCGGYRLGFIAGLHEG